MRVPDRGAAELFAAAWKETVPVPLPAAPPVIEIQEALLVAVQAQPPEATTSKEPEPPEASTVPLPELSE